MVDTLPTFVDTLRDTAILEPEQLEAVEQELSSRSDNVRALAKTLLARGWLTAFQINRLLHGKGQDLLLGPYVLLDRLGEGGMGQVFKARHQKLGRIVAIKVLRKAELKDARLIERFRREILAVAQLDHPNVVKARDAGEHADFCYYVMDYVDGMDLTRLVQGAGPLPVRQACDYLRQAALALQHAHERGLVHRDIKPSNLLVTADGTTVQLLDLGLARMRGPGPDGEQLATVTQIGVFVGTPDFVAPEQAVNSRDVDIRADIYSLGCTFYFLLTGEPPFPGDSPMDKLIKHKLEEPIKLEAARPDVPRAVVAIQRKLMAKKPEDRFQTPAEVAAALEPFCHADAEQLIQSPVPHKRPKRERKPLAALASTVQLKNGQPAAAEETDTPRPTRTQLSSVLAFRALRRPQSKRDWWRWGIASGITLVLFIAVVLVLANLVDKPNVPPPDDTKPAVAEKPAGEPKKPATLSSRLDQLDAARLPEDAREAWRAAGLRMPPELVGVLGQQLEGRQGALHAVTFAPDGKSLWTAGADRAAHLWDIGSPKDLALRGHSDAITGLALLGDKQVVTASRDRTLRLWDAASGREKQTLTGHKQEVLCLAASPDGKLLASGDSGDTILLWDAITGNQLARLKKHADRVMSLAFSPDSKRLASGCWNGEILIWDLRDREPRMKFHKSSYEVLSLAFSPDGRTLVSAGGDKVVHLWDLQSGRDAKNLALHSRVTAVAFCSDGRRLACATEEGRVAVWDATAGQTLWQTKLPAAVHGLAIAADGRHLATANGNGTVFIFRLPVN
jgi:serine/threonine protein kinase